MREDERKLEELRHGRRMLRYQIAVAKAVASGLPPPDAPSIAAVAPGPAPAQVQVGEKRARSTSEQPLPFAPPRSAAGNAEVGHPVCASARLEDIYASWKRRPYAACKLTPTFMP